MYLYRLTFSSTYMYPLVEVATDVKIYLAKKGVNYLGIRALGV